MDFERGIEFATQESAQEASPVEKPQKESSYSEAEQAKVVEGTTADMKQVPSASSGQVGNKRKPLPTVSRKEKIITSYRKNLEKIFQLVESISLLEGKNYRQEEQIVEEIKSLRHLQEELLNALILEGKDMLSEESVSKDVWNLIQ